MRVSAVELLRLELDLRFPLRTSAGEHANRPLLLIRIRTAEGAAGIGECSALAEPTYTEEYADGAEAVLRDHLIPRLLAHGGPVSAAEGVRRLDDVRGHAMAKAGLEMALLDAELTETGESLASFLGVRRTSIPAGANVSLGSPSSVTSQVKGVVADGYRRVKIKIGPGADIAVVRAVRDAFPDVALSADANGAYDLGREEHRAALLALDAFGLTCLEQPLAPGELVASAELCAMLETPVILDESIVRRSDFETAVALSALDGVSIKPARLGGLITAKAVHDRARELGLSCSIGGMLESGVGRAAAIALGALSGFDLPGDLGASDRYFVPDLTAPHVLVDGELLVPDGAGLGVQVDEETLARWTVRAERFE
jgi:O-succinylbenzoate synthase